MDKALYTKDYITMKTFLKKRPKLRQAQKTKSAALILAAFGLMITITPSAVDAQIFDGERTGDVVLSPDNLTKIDLENAIQIGTAKNPLQLGASISWPDELILDLYAAHDSEIYMTADPRTGLALSEDLELCSRGDIQCTSTGLNNQLYPSAHLKCQHGIWTRIKVTGTCLRDFYCCYRRRSGQDGFEQNGCREIQATNTIGMVSKHTSMKTSHPDYCSNDFKPNEKKYCLIDSNNKPGTTYGETAAGSNIRFVGGVTGNTGDDMFRVKSGAEVIIVYKRAPELYRSVKIMNNRDNGEPDLMIPSGPPGTFEDWIAFIEKPPKDIEITRVGTDPAIMSKLDSKELAKFAGAYCPPIAISLCGNLGDSLPTPPVVDAQCGLAHDDPEFGGPSPLYLGLNGKGFESLNSLDHDGLCSFGDPVYSQSQNDPEKLTWNCTPPSEVSGGAIASCNTPRVTVKNVSIDRVKDLGCEFNLDEEGANFSCSNFENPSWKESCPTGTVFYKKECTKKCEGCEDENDPNAIFCDEALLQCV